ncbi:MAG: hypothetical protein M1833_006325 [Piccolia ochrophora]|nr:MAG: hypothetical protein M1833_006325 [Piccolia ochrophora]
MRSAEAVPYFLLAFLAARGIALPQVYDGDGNENDDDADDGNSFGVPATVSAPPTLTVAVPSVGATSVVAPVAATPTLFDDTDDDDDGIDDADDSDDDNDGINDTDDEDDRVPGPVPIAPAQTNSVVITPTPTPAPVGDKNDTEIDTDDEDGGVVRPTTPPVNATTDGAPAEFTGAAGRIGTVGPAVVGAAVMAAAALI